MSRRKDDDEPENTWGERRDFHPDDLRLRGGGFQIHARPKKGPAVWKRNGQLYTHLEALTLNAEQGKAAKALERNDPVQG